MTVLERSNKSYWFVGTLAVVAAIGVTWLWFARPRKEYACDFPAVKSYTLYFNWDGNLNSLQIVDVQTGKNEVPSKLQAVISEEAAEKLRKIALETRLKSAQGHISLSLGGCSPPYLISWSNPDIPQLSNLMEAAEFWNLEKLKKLLATGINVNARDFQGHTALMYAAVNPMKELNKHPADLEKLGFRPDIRAVELLLKAGADPKAADAYGVTPLQLADDSTAPLMLAADANMNSRDSHGQFPR
jgi:hypothetical protein